MTITGNYGQIKIQSYDSDTNILELEGGKTFDVTGTDLETLLDKSEDVTADVSVAWIDVDDDGETSGKELFIYDTDKFQQGAGDLYNVETGQKAGRYAARQPGKSVFNLDFDGNGSIDFSGSASEGEIAINNFNIPNIIAGINENFDAFLALSTDHQKYLVANNYSEIKDSLSNLDNFEAIKSQDVQKNFLIQLAKEDQSAAQTLWDGLVGSGTGASILKGATPQQQLYFLTTLFDWSEEGKDASAAKVAEQFSSMFGKDEALLMIKEYLPLLENYGDVIAASVIAALTD